MNLRLSYRTLKATALCAGVLGCLAVGTRTAGAQAPAHVDYTKGIDFKQELGAQVPLDAELRDEAGKTVTLGSAFRGRPIILVPIAFRCQAGCAMVTDGLLKTLTKMTSTQMSAARAELGQDNYALVGQDFDVVFLSIDPLDDDPQSVKYGTPVHISDDVSAPLPNDGHVAQTRKDLIVSAYSKPESRPGWHFFTGNKENLERVTDAVGLHYFFDPKTDVLRNPTGIIFLTPKGKVSSYILGTDFSALVVKHDLLTAAAQEIGQPTERVMFVCFTPNPDVARNRVLIESIVKWTCLAFFVGLCAFIFKLSLPDLRKSIATRSHAHR